MRTIFSILVCVAILLTGSQSAFAKIETEFYNSDQSINYKSTKKVTKWTSVDWMEFVKHVQKDGKESYYLKMTVSGPGMHEKIFSETADFNIDGKSFPIKKIIIENANQYEKPPIGMAQAFFNITPELVGKIKDSQKQIIVTFNFENKNPIISKISEQNRQEMIEMASLQWTDYQTIKSR